jgi:hypothetical protein
MQDAATVLNVLRERGRRAIHHGHPAAFTA